MGFDSFEAIIRYAIEREQEAAAFYEDAGRQEHYAGARRTFEDFAAEERKHEALLEGFLKGERKLADYKFVWIPDIRRSNYMVDMQYEPGMPYTDALRLAMKREEKSLQLYNDLAEKAGQEDVVKLFRMLAQEEAKHKLKLETIYDDYMAEQGD